MDLFDRFIEKHGNPIETAGDTGKSVSKLRTILKKYKTPLAVTGMLGLGVSLLAVAGHKPSKEEK